MNLARAGLGCGAGFLLLAAQAQAEPTAAEQARAEALFDEGKRLLELKRYDEACPKLEESQRLDEGGGTLSALALCHQGQGKTATAWAEFKALLALANRTGHADRRKLAEAALAELEPRLSKLLIAVPPGASALPGFEIQLDGSVLGRASWATPMPADPGPHLVSASAAGRQPWGQPFTLGSGELHTVSVPLLAPVASASASSPLAPVAPAPASSASPLAGRAEPERGSPRRTAAFVVGGVGLAALLVGGYFGVSAVAHQREANRVCPLHECGDDAAIQKSKEADREGWLANGGLGLGVVGLVAAYLLLPPSSAVAQGRVRFLASPGQGAVVFRGGF